MFDFVPKNIVFSGNFTLFSFGGDFDTKDEENPGRERYVQLESLLGQDSCQTQDEFEKSLRITQQAISHRLVNASKSRKLSAKMRDFERRFIT